MELKSSTKKDDKCEYILYDDGDYPDLHRVKTNENSLSRYINGSVSIIPFGKDLEYELLAHSDDLQTYPTSAFYLLDRNTGEVKASFDEKILIRKKDRSEFTSDDLFELNLQIESQTRIHKCECDKIFGRSYTRYTKDYHGVIMRRLCLSCYEKAMEKGYDGVPYDED